MKERWQQIIFSVVLGLMLPGLILRMGLLLRQAKNIQLPPAQQSVSTAPSTTQSDKPPKTIPVLLKDGALSQLELEVYLVGVVLAEMPASFEEEALKAQAVVARTYAMKRISEGQRHPQGAICTDSTCCQAYISVSEYLETMGNARDVEKITQAVTDTQDLVLTYDGSFAEATYFSCSGGRTEDAAAVWGEAIPYLQAVDSPGEEGAAPYREVVSFSPEEFAAALGRSLSGSPKSWLGPVTYTQGGGVATMVVAGISYTGVRLRQLLGLNSTAFTMEISEGSIRITTQGKGHRVGMSQYGADAMAVTGSDYAAILSHYYPGTKIDKLDAIG